MAGKRQATTNLNHDNWDVEEEPEERGTFAHASAAEMKSRVIKKAKRMNTDEGDGPKQNIFSGFTGFNKTATSAQSASPFAFLSKLTPTTTAESAATLKSDANFKPMFSFGSSTAGATSTTFASTSLTTATTSPTTTTNLKEYNAKLVSLNKEVCSWIKTHVDKNPLCILSPIFLDYEKYIEELNQLKIKINKGADNDKGAKVETSPSTKPSTIFSSFTFSGKNSTTPPTDVSSTNILPQKSTSDNTDSVTTVTTSSATAKPVFPFSFGTPTSAANDTNKSQGFKGFTASTTPFTFGNIQPPPAAAAADNNNKAEDGDENDEPPKVEFKQVVEDDAVYTKKCKVFFKKDNSFADRGVGTLYLKPVKDSNKVQMLVRADTNLGNILVNLILSAGIPAERMGKNNVMLICVPMPDMEKPTSLLLRVKTAEDADELLETIKKHQK